MTQITVADVKRVTEEILAEYGEDYVYPEALRTTRCIYADPISGVPSCIVGHIASRLDPELFEVMQAWDRRSTPHPPTSPWVAFSERGLPTRFVSEIFEAQAAQDMGKPWGKAAEFILNFSDEIPA